MICRQRQLSSVHTGSLISADRRSSCSASKGTQVQRNPDLHPHRLTTQTCARPNLLTAAVNGHTGDVLRVCVRELTVQQRKLLEVEADVVLLGENVHGAAGLREQVQVELQRHS